MFFKNWNVITKVIVSFALATAFFIVVGIVGISTNSALYVFGIFQTPYVQGRSLGEGKA